MLEIIDFFFRLFPISRNQTIYAISDPKKVDDVPDKEWNYEEINRVKESSKKLEEMFKEHFKKIQDREKKDKELEEEYRKNLLELEKNMD
jgi:Skp family chaperone for outer membrane proteins